MFLSTNLLFPVCNCLYLVLPFPLLSLSYLNDHVLLSWSESLLFSHSSLCCTFCHAKFCQFGLRTVCYICCNWVVTKCNPVLLPWSILKIVVLPCSPLRCKLDPVHLTRQPGRSKADALLVSHQFHCQRTPPTQKFNPGSSKPRFEIKNHLSIWSLKHFSIVKW